MPRSKVLFKHVATHPDGFIIGLDQSGQVWICWNISSGEWQQIKHPEVEIHPTPTPTQGQVIRKYP